MPRPHRSVLRRVIAGLAVGLLATAGVVAVAPVVEPAAAASSDTINPFAIGGGFTVYARNDAHLDNQETEGSIAVGGVASVNPQSSQYTIIHVAAGTGDYTIPSVDGDPTRFLVGQYSPTSSGILAITSAGTTEPSLLGDLKMVQRDGPWQAFARADWLRLNQTPSNPDHTPLIDATHQQYPADAAPPTGSTGNGSIYTADTSATAVANYVEANRQASWAAAKQCFADIADPTAGLGHPVTIAENAGARIVLGPLSADRPNIVDYTDIAGASLLQFSPGPTPGVANPLVIRVPAGTTTVQGVRIDPQGAYSPYTVWDLSQETGKVTISGSDGGRLDGSIYAPDADVTVNAAPLDGQVIGQDVTLQGGEAHSFLFSSEIPCAAQNGTFEVRKQLDGISAGDLPAGTTFTVNYRAIEPDGTASIGTLEIPADGTVVPAGEQFPIGTVVTFAEVTPASIPGWEWAAPTIVPNPLTIGAGTAEVVVTNTATQVTGTFSVSKSIDDIAGGTPGAPSQPTVPVAWTAFDGTVVIGQGTLDVPFDGTVVNVGQQFPIGTRIVLTEDFTGITPPPGYDWNGVGWKPGRTFVIGETGTVAVELTNAVVPSESARTITIVKSATGEAADPAFGYAVSYNSDPSGTRASTALPVGAPKLLSDVETGATTLQLAEKVPTYNGTPVDPANWELPVITVTADGNTTTYTPKNFEGAGPLDTAIVDIPLPASGDIAIDVSNAIKVGTFTVSKAFVHLPSWATPQNLDFTVAWTATLPTGAVEHGVMRVPGDGTATSPLDDGGKPLLFPYGTVVTFSELPSPAVPRITWNGGVFDPEQLVIGTGGAASVHSTLTNDASLITGTFLVKKELAGIDAAQLSVKSFTVDYVADVIGQGLQTGSFQLPADGTPAGPVDSAGKPLEFPIGTVVNMTEATPDASALPDGYEWGGTTWSPASYVIVGLSTSTPTLTVTNSVVAMTRWAVTKTVSGSGSSAVPAGTTFPIDWWWDGVAQPSVNLQPGATVSSPYFPVGSIIEVKEGALPAVPGVDWGTPQWTVDGQTLPVQEDGRVILPMSAARDPHVAELTLINTANGQPLPATGGGGISPLVPVGALLAILAGAGLLIRRRRA